MKEFYTISEAADELGLTRHAVKQRIRRGTLQAVGENKELIHVSEVERLTSPDEVVEPTSKVLNEAKAILGGTEPTREDDLERELIDAKAQNRQLSLVVRRFTERGRVEDRLVREIANSLEANPYTPRIARPGPPSSVESQHEMLLLVSDAHYPEVVNPDEALGIEYGPETVRKRMEYLVDRTVRLKNLHEINYPINKLTVAVLGDMLSGNIHEELEITNAKPMGEALTDMAYMLHDMGSILAEDFAEVEMIIMPGNHPRMTKKPRNKQKFDNFEFIMGQLVLALAGDQYTVVVPKDIIYTHDILGLTVGFTHGDGSKAASFAGIPFYALKTRSNATQAMLSNLGLPRLDMFIMGHFHQMLNWTEGDCHIFINGAIKGGDEYSIVTRSSATEPVQALLTFHEEHGWISTERIPLGDIV